MKKLLILLFLVTSLAASAQRHPIHTTDPKNQKPMLVGCCDKGDLLGKDYADWFNKEFGEYKTDAATIALFAKKLKEVRIVLVMATWCSDSRREVPRFYKILDEAGVKAKKVMKVISVDREKKAEGTCVADYKVDYVPTFIIYNKEGKELGRIIETPVESLEKDLMKIVLK